MPDPDAPGQDKPRPMGLPLTGMGGDRLPEAPDRPIYTPPGGPPQNNSIDRGTYAAMGEDNIQAMIADFYGRLVRSDVAHLFPAADTVEFEAAVDRSASFFTFLLGGPPLYQQKYGPPMMRARHLPFEIDEPARRTWLACFAEALDYAEKELNLRPDHRAGFEQFLKSFSGWMVNRA